MQGADDDIDWIAAQGETLSEDTGPGTGNNPYFLISQTIHFIQVLHTVY